jgi:hypothetical protein
MPFAIHVKAWRAWRYYSSTQYYYYLQCWMEVTLTHRPLYPRSRSRLCSWIGCLEGLTDCLVNFGKGRLFSAYRESKHDCSVFQRVPQLLYQLSYPELHMWIYLLTVTNVYKLLVCSKNDCKQFISVNWNSWILPSACFYTKRYALLKASGAAALTGRRNVTGLSKADCRAGRETFSHYYCMDDVELG